MVTATDDNAPSDVLQIARNLCPQTVDTVSRVPAGGNNLLYCVDAGQQRFALKLYLSPTQDKRDRLDQEFSAYRFLHNNAVAEIPVPIASDADRRAALYSWVDGQVVGTPEDTDITRAIAFLSKLHALRDAPDARNLPDAAEASLSAAALTQQITSRRERLSEPARSSSVLSEFFEQHFDPAFQRILQSARRAYQQREWSWDVELSPASRTLSPSDFGFHNTLRVADDALVFLDFEYFGWDDPVRVVADFLLHPGHSPSLAARHRFARTMTEIYGAGDSDFAQRLHILYPLVALRWAMITLGDFLPHRMARRRQLESAADTAQILDRQMGKAHLFLSNLNSKDGAWPYGD